MKFALTLAGTLLLSGTMAFASPITYVASLSGPNENPPNGSTATGSAIVIVDAAANTLEVDVSFSGITSGTTASHIHCCISSPGATGVATTTPTFVGFPLGVTTGVYNNTLDLLDAGSYNPAFITANGGTTASAEAALLAGIAADQAYLNIHSNQFPGGEIRGFLVVPTPEPSTLALAGFALTGLVLFWRRRLTYAVKISQERHWQKYPLFFVAISLFQVAHPNSVAGSTASHRTASHGGRPKSAFGWRSAPDKRMF